MRRRTLTLFMTMAAVLALLPVTGCSTNTKDIDEVADRRPPVSQGEEAQVSGETEATPLAGDTVNAAGLTLMLPEGWVKEMPSSRMRAAQLSLSSLQSGVQNGEIAVFHFGPGGGGPILDNIVRWANQFPQEDGVDPMSRAKVEEFTVRELKVTTIDLKGRHKVSGMGPGAPEYDEPGWMLLGAIIEGQGGPWFMKGVGPEQVMEAHRDRFMSFVRSARL
jgi:hypothetical protein